MSKKAGRPKNDYEVQRVNVPAQLVPEVKKMIEQWKLDRKYAKPKHDINNLSQHNTGTAESRSSNGADSASSEKGDS